MLSAVLPGSFDPPTLGHLNLIERSSKLCERLYVVIAVNEMKQYLFSKEERLEMMQHLLKGYDNIVITTCESLIVDFAEKHRIPVMIRGVRALADFGYEFELAMTNKQLYPDLEILFMPTDPQYFVLRSSAIKELAGHVADISKMVPKLVADKLVEKLHEQ